MKYLILLLSFLYLTNDASGRPTDRIHYFKRIPRSEYSLMLNYVIPVGDFAKGYQPGSDPTPKEALFQSLHGDTRGLGVKNGFGLDFSGYYYMNNNPKPVAGGVKITYVSYNSMPFSWHTDGNQPYNDAHFSNLRFYSFNIGPVVKIKIGEEASLRIYTQLSGTIGWHGAWKNSYDYTYAGENSSTNYAHKDASLSFGTGSGVKSESGINVSMLNFIASVGFSFGRIQFDNVEYNSTTTTEVYQNVSAEGTISYQHVKTVTENQKFTVDPSIPTSYLFFSVGYKF